MKFGNTVTECVDFLGREMYRNPHGFCMCSIVYLGFFWGIRRLISTIPPNSIDTRYHIDTN